MQAQIHFQFKNRASRWHQRCRSLNENYGIDTVAYPYLVARGLGDLPLQRRALYRRFVGSSRPMLATTLTIGTGIKAQWRVENLIRG